MPVAHIGSVAALNHDPSLAEARRQHRAFVGARVVLVLLFVGLWLSLAPIGYPMPAGFLVVLLIELTALGTFYLLVNRAPTTRSLQTLFYALLAIELACHTAIVYFLGGISWLGPIAYVYALMYTAVFLSWRRAVVFTCAVGAAYMTVVALDATGVLPHQWYLPQGPDRYRDPEFLVTTSVSFVGVLATITFWMVFIGNQLRRERDFTLKAHAELLQAQAELRTLNRDLERKVEERTRVLAWRAEHDQLTQLLNREAVTRRAQELLPLARRGDRPLAVIIADADKFKICNDRAGHAYGDQVLRAISECLTESCRESDIVGRLGGDEFLIALPDTSARGALRFCRRLLKRVEAARKAWQLSGPPLPTVSLGVAAFPENGSDIDELVRVADRAMYAAKAAGGNCVSIGDSGVALPRARSRSAGATSAPGV